MPHVCAFSYDQNCVDSIAQGEPLEHKSQLAKGWLKRQGATEGMPMMPGMMPGMQGSPVPDAGLEETLRSVRLTSGGY